MTLSSRFLISMILLATSLQLQAEEPIGKPMRHPPGRAKSSFETQVVQRLAELQTQIDELRTALAAKDSKIEALQRAQGVSEDAATQTAMQVHTLSASLSSSAESVNGLRSSVANLGRESDQLSNNLHQVTEIQGQVKKDIEEPTTIHYKGVSITPGGFLAAESIWRQRAMNADIYTNFNATPYMNTGQAHTSEWVPSARGSRFSTFVSGKVPFGTLSGLFEGDFLSAGTTSNNLQSNSYTLRVRQAWGQASFGKMKFTGGQMWSLLTENRNTTDAGQEWAPMIFDGNLHVGYTYIRQVGFRLQEAFSPKVTAAIALENSQYQFSATNAPSNFFFGSAGAAPGLNNPIANYTNQVAPDILVKISFDPGYGHYEIGGVGRFFRDRYYPAGTTAANAQNDTRFGGGVVANVRFPVSKLDIGLHLVVGDGAGRYGASLLPDVTVRPNGTLSPLRNAQDLLSFEYHATKKLDLFSYVGTEYVQRTYYRDTTGTLVGYAPPTANNVGCNTEAVPVGSTGYLPGTSTCLGATRVLIQGSAGLVYKIYSGPVGRIQYGLAYSYLTRKGWTGVGGAPSATNNFVYTSFRYFLP